MAKQPWKKWWHRDWLADPNLSMCSPEARGIWVDLISSMMGEKDVSGRISGTAGQLSRVARCTPEQLENALSELESTGTASVTCHRNSVTDHAVFTVESRRMSREHCERVEARRRKRLQRSREKKTGMSQRSHGDDTRQKSDIRSHISESEAEKDISETTSPHSARAEKAGRADAVFDGHDLGVEALRKIQGSPFRAHARSGKSPPVRKRRKEVLAAVDTYGEELCRLAARNLVLSPHHRGENDRHTEYLEISYAMRKVEHYAGLCDLPDDEFGRQLPSLIAKQANGNGTNGAAVPHDNPGWCPKRAAELEKFERLAAEEAEQLAMH